MMVTDITGKIMSSEAMFRSAGRQVLSFSTADYAPGLYLLFLTDGNERMTRKFSVVR